MPKIIKIKPGPLRIRPKPSGGLDMKCYMCAKEGKDTDAVAICIICGMGVCPEHLIHEETPAWEGDYPIELKPDLEHIKRILCQPCHMALKENCLFDEVC